jgi:hypothetical protein
VEPASMCAPHGESVMHRESSDFSTNAKARKTQRLQIVFFIVALTCVSENQPKTATQRHL